MYFLVSGELTGFLWTASHKAWYALPSFLPRALFSSLSVKPNASVRLIASEATDAKAPRNCACIGFTPAATMVPVAKKDARED